MRVKLRMDRFNRPPRTTDIVIFVILFVVLFGTVTGLQKLSQQAGDVRSILIRLDRRDAADSAALIEARRIAAEDRGRHNESSECLLLEVLQHRAIDRAQLNTLLVAHGLNPVIEPMLPEVDEERLVEVCAPYYGP